MGDLVNSDPNSGGKNRQKRAENLNEKHIFEFKIHFFKINTLKSGTGSALPILNSKKDKIGIPF